MPRNFYPIRKMKISNNQNNIDKEVGSKSKAHILNNEDIRSKGFCVFENINMHRVLSRFPLPKKNKAI